jgi:chromosome segregation ATPase
MVHCEICGKACKNTQGLRGHMTFVHGQTGSSRTPVARLATEQQLSELEARLEQVEEITQLNTEQLEQYTHQLAELSDQLKNLSQQVKQASSNTEIRGISQQVTKLGDQVKRLDNWLTTNRLYYILSIKNSEHPAFLDDLENVRRQLNEQQPITNWIRKKFNLVDKMQRNLV